MPRFPTDVFFPSEFCTAATYTGAVDGAVEVELMYENEPSVQSVLNSEVENGMPRVFVRTKDVPSPRRGDIITLHPPLSEEDSDDLLLSEAGEVLLAEAQAVLKVHGTRATEFGYNGLTLSRD